MISVPTQEVSDKGTYEGPLEELLARTDTSVEPVIAQPTLAHTHAASENSERCSSQLNGDQLVAPSKIAVLKPSISTDFPVLPLAFPVGTHEQFATQIVYLATQYRDAKNYAAVRDGFVRVSLVLNRFGLLAPVFRDQPRIPYAKDKRDLSHDQLLIDQIVIDCHWLYCRKENVRPRWLELQPMFDSSRQFDCTHVAKRIARRNWSSDFKADELFSLAPRQQLQLVQIRSNRLKEQYRILVDGRSKYDPASSATKRTKSLLSPVRSVIHAWADGNHRVRGQQEMYEALWIARELLPNTATDANFAELAALRCGVAALSAKTVSGKMISLDKQLTKAGLISGKSAGV